MNVTAARIGGQQFWIVPPFDNSKIAPRSEITAFWKLVVCRPVFVSH